MKEYRMIKLDCVPAFERLKRFLSSYNSCKYICDTYLEEKQIGTIRDEDQIYRDAFYEECRRRCADVEAFIEGLRVGKDEKELLRLHYIQGMSIEAASEKMYVSRSTAFRISKRAEEGALLAFLKLEGEQRAAEEIKIS